MKCYSTFFPFFFFFFLSPAPSLTIELNVSAVILCVVRNFMFGNPAVKNVLSISPLIFPRNSSLPFYKIFSVHFFSCELAWHPLQLQKKDTRTNSKRLLFNAIYVTRNLLCGQLKHP